MSAADLMTIQIRSHGEVTVLDIDGKITIEQGTRRLYTQVRKLLKEGQRRILLDLSGVSYIDSTGVGALVAAYTSVRNADGQLCLCGVDRRVRELLECTRLLAVFDVASNQDAAFELFSGQS